MDEKGKDSVFSVILLAIGAFVTIEGVLMIRLATQPPFRINNLGISPGLLPTILGLLLIFFAALLLIGNLRGEKNRLATLARRLKTSARSLLAALTERDFLVRLAGVAWMFIYGFFILGEIPFWQIGSGFLLVILVFLRSAGLGLRLPPASDFLKLALVAAVSTASLLLLFEGIFKTTLP